jgi:hypothetical protein
VGYGQWGGWEEVRRSRGEEVKRGGGEGERGDERLEGGEERAEGECIDHHRPSIID